MVIGDVTFSVKHRYRKVRLTKLEVLLRNTVLNVKCMEISQYPLKFSVKEFAF